MSSDREVLLIVEQVQRYLASHPNAADTVEGIMQSWLTSSKQGYLSKNVDRALKTLVRQGVLTTSTLKDGRKLYKKE